MAGNFAGQEGQAGLLWPKSKCENGNKELRQNPFNSKSDLTISAPSLILRKI